MTSLVHRHQVDNQGRMLPDLATGERAALAEFVDGLRQAHNAQIIHVWLFGSKARGDSGAESDIDILVVVDHDSQEFQHAVDRLAAEANLRHGVVVSDHIVSQARYRQLRDWQEPIYADIQRDGIDLWNLEISPVT